MLRSFQFFANMLKLGGIFLIFTTFLSWTKEKWFKKPSESGVFQTQTMGNGGKMRASNKPDTDSFKNM